MSIESEIAQKPYSSKSKHQANARQIESLLDEQQSLLKEIEYLAGTSKRYLKELPNEDMTRQIDSLRKEAYEIQVCIDLSNEKNEYRERQMFEQGLFVDHVLAQFIKGLEKSRYNQSSLNKKSSSFAPPIPTAQRPGTPRSEADIKAEAFRRIQARKALFSKPPVKKSISEKQPTTNGVSDEVRAAQERMRQAETEARAHLDGMREKRNRIRQEAREAEEKKQRIAAEAAAEAEAEMLREKQRKQKEEEERLEKLRIAQQKLEEERKRERLAQIERERKLKEERDLLVLQERLKQEEKERIAEELRQKKARQAAEEAAHEKRMRRVEIEKHEMEIAVARKKEMERRKQWQETEERRRLEEENNIKKKEMEAAKLQEQYKEECRIKAEKQKEKDDRKRLEAELRKKKEKEDELKKKEEEEELKKKEEEEELKKKAKQKESYANDIYSSSTTAGTSGYGIDIEDEVNFNTIYRVKSLYEYQGIREDDLSFYASEIIKAHPSKDKASDWWYGTSLSTNHIGFFPRTYVEVIEEAFRVRTLYVFSKVRPDDLGFSENEVILVQPFQDEASGWWYGQNEETGEAGYFPKSYVETIDSETNMSLNTSALPVSIPLVQTPLSTPGNNLNNTGDSYLNADNQRGLSAPNTPIMKKTALGANKAELTKRRRAASNVSMMNNSRSNTPGIMIPHPENISESLELLTWASTMDELEIQYIPLEERQRQEAIFELIATEKTYLNDLQMIVNMFYTDFGKYLADDERDVVFSNIDDLLICNTALLSDLETRQREEGNIVSKIGDIFLKHANSLKCYSSYCQNQSYASKFLQKKRQEDYWLEVFLKTAQTRPECRSLDFSHFLLEPVQRITRYPLLLRQILNSTPKKHSDYALVKSALSVAQSILGDVNEETRRYENHQKMNELNRIIDLEGTQYTCNLPSREFVMDGVLFKAKSGRKLHGFLFNDILLLAEPLKTLNERGYLYTLYREPMVLENVSIRQQQTMSLKQQFGGSEDTSFQIVYNNQVTAVKTTTSTQKRQWMNQIQHYSSLKHYNPS